MKNNLIKIILLESYRGLGKFGDVIKVRKGFFKNFLAPGNIAIVFDKKTYDLMQSNKQEKIDIQKAKNKSIIDALTVSGKPSVSIKANASSVGMLFGAINRTHLQKLIEEKYKIKIPKNSFIMNKAIKEIGEYKILIRIGAEAVELLLSIESMSEGAGV
jgi:large subunit ribosomal protein L9